MSLITLTDILAAHTRIAPAAIRTPLTRLDLDRLRAFGLSSDLIKALPEIYLKDESAQPIGSFKLRGAYNKIAQLTPEQLALGVITYSSGNHAQGVAYSARALNSKAVIVMPSGAPQIKRDATLALGAEIVTVGNASRDRKLKAEELAAAHGYTMVPPYDDPAIIAGQATCGIEILQQLAEPAVATLILSPVSGGGLLSGVATAIKLSLEASSKDDPPFEGDGLQPQISGSSFEGDGPQPQISGSSFEGDGPQPQISGSSFEGDGLQPIRSGPPGAGGFSHGGTLQVYGCEPLLAADAAESFRTRTLVEWSAADTTRTLCDGLRTQSLGALNFEHILKFVDGIVTVTEPEIRLATRIILHCTGIVAEPSGAITLAAALFHTSELPPAQKIVAIVSGGNIDPTLRAELESESIAFAV